MTLSVLSRLLEIVRPGRRNSSKNNPPARMQHVQSPEKIVQISENIVRIPDEVVQIPEGVSTDDEQIIRGPLDYLLSSPGKDVRGKLIMGFNRWLNVPEEKLEIIRQVIGLLHTASLLIDDIQDSSKLRRGLPVAHSIYGIAQTINSANHAYFLAQEKLRELDNPEAFEIFTEELLNLHRGQGMDLYWRDALVCPTEKEYLKMISNKTGGLFRLAVKLMQMQSTCTRVCIELVDIVGLIFQIRDDYQNLKSTTYTENKGFCEDLTEGKFSFLIIHSIHSRKNDMQLLNILKQRSEDEDVKRYAIQYIESTGSFDYTREKLSVLLESARAMVKEIEADVCYSPEINAILGMLEIN